MNYSSTTILLFDIVLTGPNIILFINLHDYTKPFMHIYVLIAIYHLLNLM